MHEGLARIYTTYREKNGKDELMEHGVFYNPVQIFNRDLTLLAMQTFINRAKANFEINELEKTERLRQGEGQQIEDPHLKKIDIKESCFPEVSIVDALSASGLRTIRFLKELNGVKIVYANDISPASHRLMQDNFDLNGLDPSKYIMTMEDANLLLVNNRSKGFDIIDLDPYGSVVPFIDAALVAIRDGGMLCITCTDTRVLCGSDISKCYYYYGSLRAKVHDYNEVC